jgi:hypothetical protein
MSLMNGKVSRERQMTSFVDLSRDKRIFSTGCAGMYSGSVFEVKDRVDVEIFTRRERKAERLLSGQEGLEVVQRRGPYARDTVCCKSLRGPRNAWPAL